MTTRNSNNPTKKPKMTKTTETTTNGGTSNNNNNNKSEDDELIKQYLLQCPHVSRDSPFIKCAIEAIEKEKQRQIRDAKLQAKFNNNKNTNTTTATTNNAATTNHMSDSDVVVVESGIINLDSQTKNSNTAATAAIATDDDIMEWQDIQRQKDDDDDDDADDDDDGAMVGTGSDLIENSDTSTSFLGKELSKASIDSIAEYQVAVSTPTSAVAVALHASLRSYLLGFACTGIPEDPKACGGFAPPVRELPKTQFLPLNWEDKPNNISLRYRKNGTGALVLNVTSSSDDGQTVRVTLAPANSKEPSSQSMSFPISDHVNLDSWNAAFKAASASAKNKKCRIPPSLHYKRLAGMLSNFCQTFDLGAVVDMEETSNDIPYVDNTVMYGMNAATSHASSSSTPASSSAGGLGPLPSNRGEVPVGVAWKEGRVPATLNQAFPDAHRRYMPGGDFADDLLPGGLQDPRFLPGRGSGGRMGGNLMGPNHPMFAGGGGGFGPDGLPMGGPGTMQPRFDPVYPPGAIDDNQSSNTRRNGRQKPSRTGEPNPDHLPPPNSLGGGSDSMFL